MKDISRYKETEQHFRDKYNEKKKANIKAIVVEMDHVDSNTVLSVYCILLSISHFLVYIFYL